MSVDIREIEEQDNEQIAKVIRSSLEEFGANRPGTVYTDKGTDELSKVFNRKLATYYVAIEKSKLLGGAGIYPTDGLPNKTAELVKMYILPEARGEGVGGLLMNKCIHFAKEAGYNQLYIESMPELKKAIGMYEKFGFQKISGPLGNSGHFDCTIWMLKKL